MKNFKTKELDKKELKNTDGGCFSFDLGWLIGASIDQLEAQVYQVYLMQLLGMDYIKQIINSAR